MDHFKLKFLEEAADLVEDLEKILLSVENNGIGVESVEQIFRVMHTVKGSSSMFGFDVISEFTHQLETIYDLVRTGKMQITREILDITLASIDHIRALLEDDQLSKPQNKNNHQGLTERIGRIIGADDKHLGKHIAREEEPSTCCTYYILFKPHKTLLARGANPMYLLDDLQDMGTCKVIWHFQETPALPDLNVKDCHTYWEVILSCKQSLTEVKDVFIFVEDESTLTVQKLADEDLFLNETLVDYLEHQASKQDHIDLSRLNDLCEGSKSMTVRPQHLMEASRGAAAREPNGSIRVSSDKLDYLLNLVSELVTTQASLSLYASNQHAQSELNAIAENVEKISRRLRDNTFSICLIPIESLLTRFQRLIRDLSKQLNKEIAFVSEGTETEIDKSIIDNLTDPLMHIFRNCIDHGIEDAEERVKRGKPKQGVIALRAYYSGTNVHIEIRDDGGGINPLKIKEKAIAQKLIPSDAVLSEKEVFDLMFLPGFSTASQVTEVSGRGVGMDVVKRQITALRGAVDVESTLGQGTAITIILPLTLSIIDGLLVQIHDTKYVIPLSVVEKCYEVKDRDITNRFDNMLEFETELVPFFNLREEFGITEQTPAIQQMIVVRNNGKKIGITVDRVLDEYQAVIKPLGKLYKDVDIISGATILGDGTIALVMDTNQIVRKFAHKVHV